MKPLTDNMKVRLRLLYRRSRKKEREEDGGVLLHEQMKDRFDRFLEKRGLIVLSNPQKGTCNRTLVWTIKITADGLRLGEAAKLESHLTILKRRQSAAQLELNLVSEQIEYYEKKIRELTTGETT
jgi:hypothetical protein